MIRFFTNSHGELAAWKVDELFVRRIKVAASVIEDEQHPIEEQLRYAERKDHKNLEGYTRFGSLKEQRDGIIFLTAIYITGGERNRPVKIPLPKNLEELGLTAAP